MKNKRWKMRDNICDNIMDDIWANVSSIYDKSINIRESKNLDNISSDIWFYIDSSIVVKNKVKERILNNINNGKHIS